MEAPKVTEYPNVYDKLKSFASEHMNLRENNNKNPDLELRYPEMYNAKEGKIDYQLQLSSPMKDGKKDQIKITENGEEKTIDVVARFWCTTKDDSDGKGASVCYNLDKNGNWYMQTADKFKMLTEKDTTEWTMGNTKRVDDNEARVMITEVINRLQKTTKS